MSSTNHKPELPNPKPQSRGLGFRENLGLIELGVSGGLLISAFSVTQSLVFIGPLGYMKQGIYFLYTQKDTRYIHSPILKGTLYTLTNNSNINPISYGVEGLGLRAFHF